MSYRRPNDSISWWGSMSYRRPNDSISWWGSMSCGGPKCYISWRSWRRASLGVLRFTDGGATSEQGVADLAGQLPVGPGRVHRAARETGRVDDPFHGPVDHAEVRGAAGLYRAA